jgi:hypothetical protein
MDVHLSHESQVFLSRRGRASFDICILSTSSRGGNGVLLSSRGGDMVEVVGYKYMPVF